MKKLSIFLLGALGIMAASCDEKIPEAVPQSNPQEPIFKAEEVVTEKAGALATDAVLNLESYRADGSVIPVVKLADDKGLPEGAVVSYKLQLSDTENYARNVILDVTEGTDGAYVVDAAKWNEAHIYLFGKSPKVKKAYYRVPVYVTVDGANYRLNSADFYAVEGTLSETCMDNGFTISSAYYFLSDATSWALDDAAAMEPFKFGHSDADVYDDPVFTFKFKVTEDMFLNADGTSKDGIYWKIASQEALDQTNWDIVNGPEENGDENLSGILVDTNAQAGKLVEAGTYKLTINMEQMTYDFELLLQPDVLYTPGGANGWNQLASAWLKLVPEKAGYYGLTPVDGAGFKICADTKWDNSTDYGAETDAAALTGNLVLGQEGKNLMVPAAGLYWVKVNYDALSYELTTYELTEVTTVGMIGSFAASNSWGNDVLMTSADNGATWTADVTFAAGDEFKFRFNGDWGYNFGGDLSSLTFDSPNNIRVDEAGTYTVTLNLLGNYPNATLVKK